MKQFIHLKIRSTYSLLRSLIKISDIIKKCKKHDIKVIAINDNNLAGTRSFYQEMVRNKIKPIISCRINFKINNNLTSEISLFAKNEKGYKNLIKINSKEIEIGKNYPILDFHDLKKYSDDLIVFSGGRNSFIEKLKNSFNEKHIENIILQFNKTFKDNFYLEIQRTFKKEPLCSEKLIFSIALKNNIPIVASHNCFFLEKNDRNAYEVLLKIDDFSPEENFCENYFVPPQKIEKIFSDIPSAIDNSFYIAQRCNFLMNYNLFPVPPLFGENINEDNKTITSLAQKGLLQKTKEKKYFIRLEKELKVITKMHYSGYFLIVADFIGWTKKKGYPVGPGRGSGPGSITAWALGITDVDPIKFNLIFERFLNKDRISLPDFDIDFCPEFLKETIKYLVTKHGKEKVAQISTFGTLQSRAVIRDVGRILRIPLKIINNICKLLSGKNLSASLKNSIELKKILNEDKKFSEMFHIAQKMEGIFRHHSIHAAGIVISNKKLTEVIPIYRRKNNITNETQFEMNDVEKSGLIKFDLLGLKTLTLISNVIKKSKEKIDMEKIDLSDTKTFEIFQKGNTIGIFQCESLGIRKLLIQIKPKNIEDLTAMVALYRPGPMINMDKYIKIKTGKEKIASIHHSIDKILEKTAGIMIYQEQVMEIAKIFANYTLSQADLLRRAIGKKILKEMNKQKEIFIKGAIKKGHTKELANKVFESIAFFADYGFNRAHAVCYALIAYQTAFLKSHYPVDFFAVITSLEKDPHKIIDFIIDAQLMNIKIIPPNINLSSSDFEKSGNKIIFSFSAIKGIGNEVGKIIEHERKKNGSFSSLSDFINRIEKKHRITKKQIEILIKSGCFDKIGDSRSEDKNNYPMKNRQRMLTVIEDTIQTNYKTQNKQKSLFCLENFKEKETNLFPTKTPNIQNVQKNIILGEISSLGMLLTFNPLKKYECLIKKILLAKFRIEKKNRKNINRIISYITGNKTLVSRKGIINRHLYLSNGEENINIKFRINNFREKDFKITGNPILLDIETNRDNNLYTHKIIKDDKIDDFINRNEKRFYKIKGYFRIKKLSDLTKINRIETKFKKNILLEIMSEKKDFLGEIKIDFYTIWQIHKFKEFVAIE